MVCIPLIFTPEMMKGIISGAKTQTCRNPGLRSPVAHLTANEGTIWVRENFYEKGRWHPFSVPDGVDWEDACWNSLHEVVYTVDNPRPTSKPDDYWWRSRPSIHMPRWASRFTLGVTHIERKPVQALTLDEINREGIGHFHSYSEAVTEWERLWVSLYGDESWGRNPELVVIGFTVLNAVSAGNKN